MGTRFSYPKGKGAEAWS